MKQKVFITPDLYLSSALCLLLNITPEFKVRDKRILFLFPASENLYRAMANYNNGVAINAFEYSMMIKKLKGEMLTRRYMQK